MGNKSKIKKNATDMKTRFKFYVFDLGIIGSILGLIIYSWNTLMFKTFGLVQIGMKEAVIIGVIFIISKNIIEAFFTKEKNIDKIFSDSGSINKSYNRNILITSSIVVGYIALFLINFIIIA